MTAWSYSSIKTFEQCPKKYFHLKVAKDFKDGDSEALRYGNLVHKAAEDYIKSGTPVPKKYDFMVPILEGLEAIPGDKHCEIRMGVAYDGAEYTPTEFFADNVWYRGIADLLIVDGEKAFLVDYKTGKNAKYADTNQLDILAASVFTHYPKVKRIKSALIYVVSKEFIHKEHTANLVKSYFATFEPKLERLVGAIETGVWNAVSGPLCRFCPVTSCEHNRK